MEMSGNHRWQQKIPPLKWDLMTRFATNVAEPRLRLIKFTTFSIAVKHVSTQRNVEATGVAPANPDSQSGFCTGSAPTSS